MIALSPRGRGGLGSHGRDTAWRGRAPGTAGCSRRCPAPLAPHRGAAGETLPRQLLGVVLEATRDGFAFRALHLIGFRRSETG